MNRHVTIIPHHFASNFTIYQVDLNEINLGSYLLTKHRIDQLIYRVHLHTFNLCKTLYMYQPKTKPIVELEFQLMMKVHDTKAKKKIENFIIQLGNYGKWRQNLKNWWKQNNKGCNLYIEVFYILTYEKCTGE